MSVKQKYPKYIKYIVYLVIVVLVNIAGMTLFFRLDLTGNKVYSISRASKAAVSTLTEPLTIKVFFTKNLPAPHNNTERYLRDLLQEYAIHANNFFNYKFYNVSPETESVNPSAATNQKLAENYGIRPVQIQAIENDEVKFKRAFMGLVMIHGDMVEKIPTITSINGLEYTVTTTIRKLNNKISAMLKLEEKIKVKLYLSSAIKTVAPQMGLNSLADYPAEIKKTVDELNGRLYGKLEYIHIDPKTEAEQQAASEAYNLMHLKWPAIAEANIPAGAGVIGLIMEHDGRKREIPILQVMRIPIIGTQYNLMPLDEMQEVINENIETLVDINEDVGYLADHGTPDASGFSPFSQRNPEALNNFSTLLSGYYNMKQVELSGGKIPVGLKSLVIAQPMEPFTDYELYQIDQALMRGTNLVLFLDVFKETQNPQANMGFNQGPSFTPFNSGLESLLGHYGLRIKPSLVMDENCHRQRMPQNMGGGDQPIYYAPIIKNENINHDLAFMKDIKGLVVLKASPLEIDEERLSEIKVKAHKVFSSSEKSWEMRERIMLNPMFIMPPADESEKESLALSYYLEGEFPSYFDGKPIPESPAEAESEDPSAENKDEDALAAEKPSPDPVLQQIEGTGGFIAKSKPGRIFLMGTSDVLRDNIISPEGNAPNDMFVLNVIDAANGREEIAAMRSKVQQFNPLADSSPAEKAFLKIFNIAGLPVFVVIFGLFIMLRRYSRKKQIQMTFQK
ncbi:MAG: ABC transporter permease [Desulfobacteraceae bacterium]|nr:ABC transporter permease [Desulfobacteraceae bacterium]